MKNIYVLYKTDNRHTYCSRELLGLFTTKTLLMRAVRNQVKKEGEKLSADDVYNLEHLSQTQGFEGDGEFHFEPISKNTLL